MKAIIIFILLVFWGCKTSKENNLIEEDRLFSEAFCVIMKAKHEFKTPNNTSKDTLFVLDEYYIDTTSLYYNQMNAMFEIGYIDSTNFPNHTKGTEHWSTFQRFSAKRATRNHHIIDLDCLDSMNIKFISEKNVEATSQKSRTFLFSPMIKLNEEHYEIYEHDIRRPAEYYYAYILKRVGNSFEFVRRRYYEDLFWPVREDYMNTIDFDQAYKEFVAKRK